jgi:Leucine-rich repeat (LRR) protein
MTSLKWLRLNGNQITALPADLSGLAVNLSRLYLKGNPIPDPEKTRIKTALPKCEVIF